MGWSGGTYSKARDWTTDAAGGSNIEASLFDEQDDDFAAGINACLHKGGQNAATANLPMGGNRHTGVGNAAALTDYASAADVIDQHLTYYVDTGAADAYVITPSPSIGAYAEGQRLVFRASANNTGATTLNVNGLGTRAIQTADGSALSGGEIITGGYYEVVYDANTTPDRWVLMSPSSSSFQVIGTDVQAWDAGLDDIAALTETTDSTFIVGSATGWVQENAATARTSLGVGTGDSPQFTAINVGHASDTTVGREGAGQINVEGQTILSHGTGQTNANYSSARVYMSTSAASGGAAGDIWFTYTA